MAIEYIRRTPTTNQEYFNKQLEQAVNEIVNRVNINYKKVTTSTYDILVDNLFIDVNVGTATTLSLPQNPPIGTNFIVKDSSGSAGTNNITVTPASGNTIQGQANFVINNNFGSLEIIYNGTNQWLVIQNQ